MDIHTILFSRFQEALDTSDPRVNEYFLMGSPFPVATILALYTLFVFKIGPQLMKNRKPLKLEGMMIIYNWVQIIANGYIFVLALELLPNMNIFCSPVIDVRQPSTHDELLIFVYYCYAILKVLDLTDTVFFILRKKNNQVTFLHVYHHIMMACVAWANLKFYPGGHSCFVGSPNLLVHVVMYFYYFLTAWRSEYKRNVWWKKYITQLQIVQHCFISISQFLPLVNPYCSYSKPWLLLHLSQSLLMIYLFGNFYFKSYVREEKKKQ